MDITFLSLEGGTFSSSFNVFFDIRKGSLGGPIVLSRANPDESFYYNGVIWRDLYEYRFANPNWAMFDRSANFCMKALAVNGK